LPGSGWTGEQPERHRLLNRRTAKHLPGKFEANVITQRLFYLGNRSGSSLQGSGPVLTLHVDHTGLPCGLQVKYPVEAHEIGL
jgi:hypothetical protein